MKPRLDDTYHPCYDIHIIRFGFDEGPPMRGVVVDTSVWVAFFRGRPEDKIASDALGEAVMDTILFG